MDHLESVRAIFRAAPFVVDLGIEPTAIGEGRCESVLPLQQRHLQHTGHVHAGVLTTLADHTAGAAAQSLCPEGAYVLTAELKISLLRATRGKVLTCAAVVIKPGRAVMFTEAEVFCHDGDAAQRTLVAKLSATMAVVQSAPAR